MEQEMEFNWGIKGDNIKIDENNKNKVEKINEDGNESIYSFSSQGTTSICYYCKTKNADPKQKHKIIHSFFHLNSCINTNVKLNKL